MRKIDPLNDVVLPLIGAALLAWVWWEGWVPWGYIKAFVFHDLL